MPPEANESQLTAEAEGHWVGTAKERYDFVLKLLEKKSTSRGYFVYRMTDKQGNLYIAFDGRSDWQVEDDHKLETYDCFTCRATVNRHDIANYKYGGPDSRHKQTVLNRIKLKAFIGRNEE